MPTSPLYVVSNAVSGHGNAETTCRAIAEVLTAAGRTHEILHVGNPEQLAVTAREAVERAQQNKGIVVAVGGDGTLNTVAQATLGSGCAFGVIPQGTFNYFGRTHGISSDAGEAARALLSARVVPVQVGLVNDRVFLVNAGLGLYPQSLEDREAQKKRLGRSRLVAVWAALLTVFRDYRPMAIRLEHKERVVELRTLTLFVGNNRLQLEQVGLDESSNVEEGKLVVILLPPVTTVALLSLMFKGALGRLGKAQGVQHFSLSNLTVTPVRRRASRLKVAFDGEICWMDAPIEFRVAPEPLLLLTPIDAVPETA